MKGLIFLHGEDKKNAESPSKKEPYYIDDEPDFPIKVQPLPINPYGFAPLDEIKPPDLTRGGYSIHSDLSY